MRDKFELLSEMAKAQNLGDSVSLEELQAEYDRDHKRGPRPSVNLSVNPHVFRRLKHEYSPLPMDYERLP